MSSLFDIDNEHIHQLGDTVLGECKITKVLTHSISISGSLFIMDENRLKELRLLCSDFGVKKLIIESGNVNMYIEKDFNFHNISIECSNEIVFEGEKGCKVKNLSLLVNTVVIRADMNFINCDIDCKDFCMNVSSSIVPNFINSTCNILYIFYSGFRSMRDEKESKILVEKLSEQQLNNVIQKFNINQPQITYKDTPRIDVYEFHEILNKILMVKYEKVDGVWKEINRIEK